MKFRGQPGTTYHIPQHRRAFWWLHLVLRRFGRDEAGHAALFFGLAAIPMIGAAGLALDAGRAYLVENRLTHALDAAGLAAARVGQLDTAADEARRFFDANYPATYLSSRVEQFDYSYDAATGTATVVAQARIPTTLMQILGQDSISVAHQSKVRRLTRGLELALIMDVTGSMRWEGKFWAMQASARDLVQALFTSETMENVWVSLVPYVASVNVGTDKLDWLVDSTVVSGQDSAFGVEGWHGCVEARSGQIGGVPGDEAEDEPTDGKSASRFTPYLYPPDASDNNYDPSDASTLISERTAIEEGTGPNLGCAPEIAPLTNVRSELLDRIDNLYMGYRGGTTSNLGLAWGWRTISPKWRGLWPGLDGAWSGPEGATDLPLDYDYNLMTKAVVLLTDGENLFYDYGRAGPEGSDYTAYGRLNDWQPGYNRDAGRQALDDKLERLCERMKTEGIEVYTITFGRLGTVVQDLYQGCATSPDQYFHAPNGDQLRTAFRQIGQQLSNLRVVQ